MQKHTTIKIMAAFWAGLVAISLNTILLKIARYLGIVAESGGLLKLLVIYLKPSMEKFGVSEKWTALGFPGPASLPFWLVFHYMTGYLMVLLYTLIFRPRTSERRFIGGLVKGSIFSLLPWLIHCLFVLPQLGQKPFGIHRLTKLGIAYFFIANWTFGAVLGILYEQFYSFIIWKTHRRS